MTSDSTTRAPRDAEGAWLTQSATQTMSLAQELGRRLRGAVRDGLLLTLEGDLGAGKTTFVRGLARGLGLPADVAVTSPTFAIAQRFDLPGGGELHHLDLHRLGSATELEQAGFEECWGEGRLTCVEWPERAASGLPQDRLEVVLVTTAPPESPRDPLPGSSDESFLTPPTGRRITLRARGERARGWLAGLTSAAGAARR